MKKGILKKILGWVLIANVFQLLIFTALFSIAGGDLLRAYCFSWAAIGLTVVALGLIGLGIVLIDE